MYVENTNSTDTSWTDTNVESGPLYEYHVRAINDVGVGDLNRYDSTSVLAPYVSELVIVGHGRGPFAAGSSDPLTIAVNNLARDDDPDTVDYILRGDVTLDTDGSDADECEGDGLGEDVQINVVDEQVEYFDATVGGGYCGEGTYTVTLVLNDGDRDELLSVSWEYEVGQSHLAVFPVDIVWLPAISGTAQVDETLTADTSRISDDDGLDNAIFTYQWIRSDGTTDTEIAGATATTYLVTTDDVGSVLRVRVSFTDDGGNDESLTSASTGTVIASVPGVPRSLDVQPSGTGRLTASWQGPASNGGATITGYTLRWKEATDSWDSVSDVSSATTTETSYIITGLSLGTEYSVRVIATNSAGDSSASAEVKETADAQTSPQQAATQNTPATGAPTISGTVHVSETLTADTSGIADADGTANTTFTYQWLADNAAIAGATGSTYTLADADEGKAIKVQVSFTDDAGNDETLTSAATDAVTAAPPPNNPATGAPTISGTARVGETLTVDTSKIADPDGMETDDEFAFTWFSNDNETGQRLLWWVEWEGTYRIEPRDAGKTIGVQVSFRDDRGNIEFLESTPTDTVGAAANTPATGQPTISGTAQVGETLTADTSGIADADGLTNADFTYQWLSSRDTEIGGATSSTYTLQASDESKAITVRVSFTDDAGNVETVISRATAAVGPLGICDRTEQVRDNIISMLNAQSLGSLGIKDCSEVTDEYLTRIWVLDLNGGGVFAQKITSLKSGDFQGLSGLTELELVGNSLSELPEGVFDGLASLEILTMHENALGSLPEGVFDDLTNLYALALHDNELSSLSGDVFTGVGGLTRLLAANNNLTSLPDGVFSGMSKLQEVNLSGNPNAPFTLTAELERKGDEGVVVKVGEGAPFAMTVTLSAQGGTLSATTVVIDGGDTESTVVTVTPEGAGAVTVNVDSAAFPDAGTVREGIQAGVGESLTLEAAASGICDRTQQVQDAILGWLYGVDDCADVTDSHLGGITIGLWISGNDPNNRPALSLESGDFAGLVNIRELIIYNHTMDALPEDVFDGLGSLERLYLSANEIAALPEDVFDGLGSLERLDLSANEIAALPEDVFDGLGSLESLYLSANDIAALPEDVFDGLGSLESLDLGKNQIGTLPEDVFDGLGNLKYLELFGNRINALPEDVFDGLGSLKYLLLSFNQLSTLPDDVFDDLGNLVSLDVQVNQLSALREDAFNGLGSLERLDLSYNEIARLPEDVFDGLGNLKSLRLGSNDLASLPEDVFDGLDSLTQLTLSHNRIHTLPEVVFEGLGNLTYLSLHSNQTSVLPEDVFDELGNLTSLALDGNQLGALPEGVFDELGNLTSLSLPTAVVQEPDTCAARRCFRRPQQPEQTVLVGQSWHAVYSTGDTLHSQTRELVEYGGDRDRCAGSTVPGPTDCQSRHPARRGQCLAESTQPGCDTSGLALHYRGCAHQAKVTLPINTKTLNH